MLLIIVNIHTHIRNKQLSSYDFLLVVVLKIVLALLLIFLWWKIKYLNLK